MRPVTGLAAHRTQARALAQHEGALLGAGEAARRRHERSAGRAEQQGGDHGQPLGRGSEQIGARLGRQPDELCHRGGHRLRCNEFLQGEQQREGVLEGTTGNTSLLTLGAHRHMQVAQIRDLGCLDVGECDGAATAGVVPGRMHGLYRPTTGRDHDHHIVRLHAGEQIRAGDRGNGADPLRLQACCSYGIGVVRGAHADQDDPVGGRDLALSPGIAGIEVRSESVEHSRLALEVGAEEHGIHQASVRGGSGNCAVSTASGTYRQCGRWRAA